MMLFCGGTPTFDVLEYLREQAGVGPGNFTQDSLRALIGDSRLETDYVIEPGNDAMKMLCEIVQWLPLTLTVVRGQLRISKKDLSC